MRSLRIRKAKPLPPARVIRIAGRVVLDRWQTMDIRCHEPIFNVVSLPLVSILEGKLATGRSGFPGGLHN